jgi:flagellar biosynthetic protein FliQ
MEAGGLLALMDWLLLGSLSFAAPMLAAAMVSGVLIAMLSEAMQIQNRTIGAAPKVLISGGVIVALGPWLVAAIAPLALGMMTLAP